MKFHEYGKHLRHFIRQNEQFVESYIHRDRTLALPNERNKQDFDRFTIRTERNLPLHRRNKLH